MATLGRVHDVGTGPQEPNWPSWTALPGRCTGAGWNRWRCRRTRPVKQMPRMFVPQLAQLICLYRNKLCGSTWLTCENAGSMSPDRSSCPDRISLPNGWFYLKALHGGAPNRYDSIAIYVASALGFQQESVSLTTGVRTDRRFSSRSGARSSRTAGTGTQTNALRPKYPRDGGRGDPAEVLADPLQ